MNRDEIAARLAADINEQTRNDEALSGLVAWINEDLGESPEAIRGAMTAFMILGAVIMTGIQVDKDPTVGVINLIAAWQAQPHVMHMLGEAIERARRERE